MGEETRVHSLVNECLVFARVTAAQAPPDGTQIETARRVRAARAYAGMSVSELAERVGLGLQTIKRIESGKRNARPFEVWAIAEACELPREFFDLDFQDLCRAAAAQRDMLARIDYRLDKLERALGGPG
jgi:transcriptional regulator with XRE-family HTH domain